MSKFFLNFLNPTHTQHESYLKLTEIFSHPTNTANLKGYLIPDIALQRIVSALSKRIEIRWFVAPSVACRRVAGNLQVSTNRQSTLIISYLCKSSVYVHEKVSSVHLKDTRWLHTGNNNNLRIIYINNIICTYTHSHILRSCQNKRRARDVGRRGNICNYGPGDSFNFTLMPKCFWLAQRENLLITNTMGWMMDILR